MFALPIPILFAITIVACCVKSVFDGYFSKKVSSDDCHTWLFGLLQSVFCLVSIIGIFLVSGGLGHFSFFSLGLGLIIGAASIFCLIATLKAFAVGPFSYTTVITSLGSVIPTLSGYFFGESVTLVQYIGVVLMIVCLFLSPEGSKEGESKTATAKWLLLSLTASLLSGTVGVVQKIHQTSDYRDERAAMLVGAFAFSIAVSAVICIRQSRKTPKSNVTSARRRLWLIPVFTGMIFGFQHTVNLSLSGAMPAIIVFPLVNLCPMILSMVCGFIIFREKLSLKRWIGVVVGILSSILVSGIV